VVERPVVVFENGYADLRAVAGTDGRLMRFLGESARRVQPLDTRPSALVDVDECLPAFDDPDAVNIFEVVDLVLRRRDDVFGAIALAGLSLDGES